MTSNSNVDSCVRLNWICPSELVCTDKKCPRYKNSDSPLLFLLHQRVEAYSKEPVMTDPEETKGGGDVYPYATLRTGEYPHDSNPFQFVGRLQMKIGHFLYTPT